MEGMTRFLLTLALLASSGCVARMAYDDRDLDGGTHRVPSSLLSVRKPHPTPAELARPVVVATHGYSATTWDTQLLAEALEKRDVQVSNVNLGAHGTSLAEFEASTWRTWEEPLVAEYRALRKQGYQHVGIFGHSTGATLWLQALADNRLGVMPERLAFLAPLIQFSSRTRLIQIAGLAPFLGVRAIERPVAGASKGHIYRFRPITTLRTLEELTSGVHRKLVHGLALPAASRVLIIQGEGDEVVDPQGVQDLAHGLIGPSVQVMVVPTGMHNPIAPDGIQGHVFTSAEAGLRQRIIDAIVGLY
ncbi:MAG: esterase [Cyanobacteria bacterium RYN_339]|nr:esterase [Cyanobacteria bacterium RYN_339]